MAEQNTAVIKTVGQILVGVALAHGNQVTTDIDLGEVREIAITVMITYGLNPTVDGRMWLLGSPNVFATSDDQDPTNAFGYFDIARASNTVRVRTKAYTVNARYIRFVLSNPDPAVNWGNYAVWLHTCKTS